jgi:hypothetical protein
MPAGIRYRKSNSATHSLVNKVLYDEKKQKATGVEIVDTETKKTEEFYAPNYFSSMLPQWPLLSFCLNSTFIAFSKWSWAMEVTRLVVT